MDSVKTSGFRIFFLCGILYKYEVTLTNARRSSIVTNAKVAKFGDVHQEKNKFIFTVKKHKIRRTYGKEPVVLSDTTYIKDYEIHQAHQTNHQTTGSVQRLPVP